jgi:hypothetical protein
MQNSRQSVSAPRGKPGARLNAGTKLRATRQRSAREAIYRAYFVPFQLQCSLILKPLELTYWDTSQMLKAKTGAHLSAVRLNVTLFVPEAT